MNSFAQKIKSLPREPYSEGRFITAQCRILSDHRGTALGRVEAIRFIVNETGEWIGLVVIKSILVAGGGIGESSRNRRIGAVREPARWVHRETEWTLDAIESIFLPAEPIIEGINEPELAPAPAPAPATSIPEPENWGEWKKAISEIIENSGTSLSHGELTKKAQGFRREGKTTADFINSFFEGD